jgi:hypothetical protein
MKNKALIILLAVFLAVILLSLLVNRQNQNAASPEENEAAATRGQEAQAVPEYAGPAAPAKEAGLLSINSGVTIISAAAPTKEKELSAPKKVGLSSGNIPSLPEASSSAPEQSDPQTGITQIGKLPPPKEAKEMNSRGIVMY